jgi:hypothetical protein
MPWPDSDLSLEDLLLGWERVEASGIEVEKCRVTGGEPTLHPLFTGALRIIRQTWCENYGGRITVFSNGSQKLPPPFGWRYAVASREAKNVLLPPMISPIDLGLEHPCGVTKYCHRRRGCGRLFDAYGFAGCVFSGAIGRIIRYDPYRAEPVIQDGEVICGHCPFSTGVKMAFRLFEGARSGAIEYPTETYRKGLKDFKEKGLFTFKKFRDRSV